MARTRQAKRKAVTKQARREAVITAREKRKALIESCLYRSARSTGRKKVESRNRSGVFGYGLT